MSLDPLSDALGLPLTTQARTEFIRQLWTEPHYTLRATSSSDLNWNAYFNFYNRECNEALANERQHFCARTHGDLLLIAQLLQTKADKDKVMYRTRTIFGQMHNQTSEEEERILEGFVKLATRIVAMISAETLPNEVSGQRSILWNCKTLEEAVYDHFEEGVDVDAESATLGTDFTARNINRVAKIGIIWTDNLVDHLRLMKSDRKLCVFHHASFLKHMRHSRMYPNDFVRETLDTLTLLFPSTDRKTKEWLQAELPADISFTQIDLGLLHMGTFTPGHASRRLENYRFWRARLGALKDALDEATPPSKTLLEALRNRKQGDRWLNSWVAIVAIGLTLFFGLVQSIEGALQVYKAYHPATG